MFLVRPLHWRHSAVCSKSNNKENFKACKGAQHKYTINRKVCDVITMWLPLPWNLHENTFLITYQVGGGGTCDSSFKSKYTYVIQSRVPWNKTKWQLNFYITVTHQSRMLFETSCSGQRNWLTNSNGDPCDGHNLSIISLDWLPWSIYLNMSSIPSCVIPHL